ncbi:GNAT family N-acetyltransferase [Streptomyces sp. A7024]|uniref:GNAT family N-acetyltransferase n=1 Tax=Streptomyces coryli TaxID=1128680 RepID=A0A6G4U1A9_9ACTN|nr:GNAT family N-acetyltransferase [Streptomyces coryli]NGN65782.1 GNAT family N-acetyltransferase [Streptomyces coryli]
MTTTLRPAGPETRDESGVRRRSYEVCVNGRPVGTVALTTDARWGSSAGRIENLRIDEPDRRRGRATVAALAAEEVLRGWGCGRVEISVQAGEDAGLRLATALGYVERSRNMIKQLPATPPSLPEGSRPRPMTRAEYQAWAAAAAGTYAQDWIDRGVPAAEARAKAERDHAESLPDGLDTPGVHLGVLEHDGAVVGILWIDPGGAKESGVRWVYDVEVREEHRGRGHGRTLMLVAEQVALAAGADRLRLNVFAGNTPALKLYESLGYEPTAWHLYKPLL